MEVVAYGILTALWWTASCTILLPFFLLLKLSKSFQNRWFAWVFTKVTKPIIGGKNMPFREKIFQLLKAELGNRGKKTAVRILEIGVGSGPNLRFYPENSSLIAVDVNPAFDKFFHDTRQHYPQVRLEKVIHAMAEDMKEVDDDSVDVVVSTHVLCSVEDVDKVLNEIYRILKPGGVFVFLEHVAYERNRWESTIQAIVSPLWFVYFAGCCINRNHSSKIKNAGFSRVEIENIEIDIWLYLRPNIIGLAVK